MPSARSTAGVWPLGLSLSLLCACALAQTPPAAASSPDAAPLTRAEVAARRAVLERQFASDQADCEQRFVVSSCLEALRERRRAAFKPLVAREHELAAQERQARAAAQVQRVREREAAAASEEAQRRVRLAAPPPVPAASAASHPVRALSPERAERQRVQAERHASEVAQQRLAQRNEREQRQQQRQRQHEQRLQQKTQPAAAPLPVPGASAARAASAAG